MAASDTETRHLSLFVQDMKTRGVANLQVSAWQDGFSDRTPVSLCSGHEDKRCGQLAGECMAATGHLSPFVQDMKTRGVANLQVSAWQDGFSNRTPVSLCSGHEDKRCGQLAGECMAATGHLSPFVQDMKTRGVVNLQVSAWQQ